MCLWQLQMKRRANCETHRTVDRNWPIYVIQTHSSFTDKILRHTINVNSNSRISRPLILNFDVTFSQQKGVMFDRWRIQIEKLSIVPYKFSCEKAGGATLIGLALVLLGCYGRWNDLSPKSPQKLWVECMPHQL